LLTLCFPPADIAYWAARYDYPGEATIAAELAPAARAGGYLTHTDLVTLGRWKSPHIVSRCAANEPAYVAAVTTAALGASNERLRIEILTLLRGVGWPMASVILHWCHRDPYPILDFRALESMGIAPPPPYAFGFWWEYTTCCREMADSAGVSMRELDRALWQYSKEKPPYTSS
jgi:hypothetical protein